jgi:hypothetical protein
MCTNLVRTPPLLARDNGMTRKLATGTFIGRGKEHRPIGRTGSHVVQHSDLLSDVLSGHAPIIVLRAPRRSVVTEQSAMAAAAVEPWLSHLRWGEVEGGRRLDGGCDVIAASRATAVGRSTGGCTADVLGGLP